MSQLNLLLPVLNSIVPGFTAPAGAFLNGGFKSLPPFVAFACSAVKLVTSNSNVVFGAYTICSLIQIYIK